MKVACVSNINNMMFIMCRYLRDQGIDATLLTLNDEPAHFNPGADSYDESYKEFCSIIPISKSQICEPESVEILTDSLEGFDFYIGTDIAPALLTLIGKKLDVFVPHGSDIYHLPFEHEREKGVDRVWWNRNINVMGQLQYLGISQISTILFPDEYEIHFPYKNKLTTKATFHNTSGPMVYIPQYKDLLKRPNLEQIENYAQFKAIRDNSDLMIFSHSRHNGFNLPPEMAVHQKGNDVLIKGVSLFVKEHPELKVSLVFFDYGIDVEASKTLIEEEDLTSSVAWMPLMQRKEIMLGLKMSDISCGQFDNSWLTCGVVNETLATDVPLLHYRDDALYEQDYAELYPLLNANTPAEISKAIEESLTDKSEKKESLSGSEWLLKYTVNNPLAIVSEAMNRKGKQSSKLDKDGQADRASILKKFYKKDKLYRAMGSAKQKVKKLKP